MITRDRAGRPVTRASINSRSQIRTKKEWDDRFSIERMPQYNALRDKHCQAYVNMIKKKHKKPKRIQPQVEMGPGRIRRRKIRTNYDVGEERTGSRRMGRKPPKAEAIRKRAAITDEIMSNLEQELNKLWDENNVIQYHRDTFSSSLKSLARESSAAMMAKEIDDLKKNKAPIQKVSLGIIARENCLREVKEYRYEEGENLDDFITKCTHKLHSLRMLSLNAVECIVIWREQMLYAYNQSLSMVAEPAPELPFLWNGENYLVKIKNDTDFLKDHSLAEWFNFSDKNDPFLVIPSCAHSGVGLKALKKGRKKQSKKKIVKDGNKYEVPLDNSLMQRIRASEVILEKEAAGSVTEPSMSPQTNKTMESPSKSDKKLVQNNIPESRNEENNHPNHDSAHVVNQRESLFDLRKKKNDSHKKLPQENGVLKPEVEKPQPVDVPMTDTSPIEEVENEEEEIFDYDFIAINIKESQAVEYLQNYIEKLDEKLALTFAEPNDLVEKVYTGNNTQWIGLKNKGSRSEIDGLFIYNVDPHFSRVNIHHLTTLSRKGLESAISKAIDYIWKNENVHEIRLGLYHYEGEKNGKKAKVFDTEYRDILKKNKLKWKNMLNQEHHRILVMGANRPADYGEPNFEYEHLLSLKSALMYAVTANNPGTSTVNHEHSMFYIPSMYLNSLLSHRLKDISEDATVPEAHKVLNDLLFEFQGANQEALPATVSTTSTDLEKAAEPASFNKIEISGKDIAKDCEEYHCNALTLAGKILCVDYYIHKVNSQAYKFLRIKSKEIITVQVNSISSKILFMPLESEQKVGMMVFKKPADARFDTPEDLYDYCKAITREMKESATAQTSGLYLP